MCTSCTQYEDRVLPFREVVYQVVLVISGACVFINVVEEEIEYCRYCEQ